ncbi:type II secretion system protein M [Neisseriaceae bacterium TC5R-5]|nr:type II secretion system protein M [Neisseriaceae bacterium TC5R-5]
MQQYRQRWMTYWAQRSTRERVLLWLMALVLGVGVLYGGIWEPATSSLERNRLAVSKLQAERRYIQSLAQEAEKLKRQPVQTALPAKELITVIQQLAQNQGLPQTGWQLTPEGSSGVQLQGVVNFNAWSKLTGLLAERHQIQVLSLQAEAQPQPGQVNIKAVLVHAGAI